MRELKFRAWHKKDKCWIGGFAIHSSGLYSGCIDAKREYGVAVADAHWDEGAEDVVITQYTGIKDRNGKEMYDGDIITFRANYCPVSKPMGTFNGVLTMTPYKLVIMVGDIEYDAENETDEFPYHHCEVVGNIFTDPEFAKKNKADTN